MNRREVHSTRDRPDSSVSTLRESTLKSNPYELEALLSDRFVLTWRQAALIGWVCTLLVLISYAPLAHHTTWLLASRGEAILTTGHLPHTDVTQSLAEGLSTWETSWLSSVFWALVARQSLEAVSWTTTVLAGVSLIALTSLLWWRTRNALLTGIGITGFALMTWTTLNVGSAILLVLPLWIALVAVQSSQTFANVSLPSCMLTLGMVLLWANLDSSVFVAIGLLAIVLLGNTVTWLSEHGGDVKSLFADRGFQLSAVTLELALLSTLATPLGTSLWSASFQELTLAGAPLSLTTLPGLLWLLTIVGGAIVLRKLSERLPWSEVFLFGGFATACLLSGATIIWFAPLAILVLTARLQTALQLTPDKSPVDIESNNQQEGKPPLLKFAFTLSAILFCWIAFAISPLSRPVLGGEARTVSQLFAETTPVVAVRYFREHPVTGIVYAPLGWSDLLQSHQGARAKVFATSSFRNLPQQAKFDFNRLAHGDSSWESIADRYAIDAFLVDKAAQPTLVDALTGDNANWQTVHENDLFLIVRRRGA